MLILKKVSRRQQKHENLCFNCLFSLKVFFGKVNFEKVGRRQQKLKNYPVCKVLKNYYFAGVDNSNMYMWRQGEDAFSDVEMPTDYCATLAMRTNGSLFDATHSVQGNLRQQRHFMRTLGDRVGMSGSQTQCQECSCELDETGTPASVCRRCDLQPFYFKVSNSKPPFDTF